MLTISSLLSLLLSTIVLIAPAKAADGDNPAFVVVLDSNTDMAELCHTFETLARASGFADAPIIAFNALPFNPETLRSCTNRNIHFADITDYHAYIPESVETVVGTNYDFVQTQRFLTTDVWERAEILQYDVIMQITDATCLTFEDGDLPGFPQGPELNYKSFSVPGQLEPTEHTVGIYQSTLEYMSSVPGLVPANVNQWSLIVRSHEDSNKLPKFSEDFQIVRKSFMQDPQVRAFTNFLTSSPDTVGSFFDRRWSAGTLMFVTVALFSPFDKTSNTHMPGVVEKDFLSGNTFDNICRNPSTVFRVNGLRVS